MIYVQVRKDYEKIKRETNFSLIENSREEVRWNTGLWLVNTGSRDLNTGLLLVNTGLRDLNTGLWFVFDDNLIISRFWLRSEKTQTPMRLSRWFFKPIFLKSISFPILF